VSALTMFIRAKRSFSHGRLGAYYAHIGWNKKIAKNLIGITRRCKNPRFRRIELQNTEKWILYFLRY
jgi:hypothetical protein